MQAPEVMAQPALMAMTLPQLHALIAQVHGQADLARTCMQMFYVFLMNNQHEAAADVQRRALQLQRLYRLQASAQPPPQPEPQPLLRLLVLMGPGAMQDNTPIEFVLHGNRVQTEILYLLPGEPMPRVLPLHDITFIAIGESTRNAVLLEQIDAALPIWPTPILNHPHAIAHCARDTCYQRLSHISGVRMPLTRRVQRGEVLAMDFPFTLRPVDTQGGEGLERIEQANQLQDYFARFPAESFYAAEFIDYQSEDGCYRKLRIVLIDGAPFICHLAISKHWMVHYLSAGMQDSAEKRLEEQCAMENFETDFALRFKAELAAIAQALQLDYVTLDCAIARDGQLLVFEADSRGLIHAADPVHLYPYKPFVMQKAFDAFANMLRRRLGNQPGARSPAQIDAG
jgi:glutathione synthase/RimK-type ligase-like ATP-grasp enzyme